MTPAEALCKRDSLTCSCCTVSAQHLLMLNLLTALTSNMDCCAGCASSQRFVALQDWRVPSRSIALPPLASLGSCHTLRGFCGKRALRQSGLHASTPCRARVDASVHLPLPGACPAACAALAQYQLFRLCRACVW
jgi:hypothetical protein